MELLSLTPGNILDYGFCGYKDSSKHKEMTRKGEWYRTYYPLGLRIVVLMSDAHGSQGMIEYIPGEFVHRPVNADGWMMIHCLFVGYRREYKGRGFGSQLIGHCVDDSRKQGKKGVAAVVRTGSFMANRDVFVKNGFSTVDRRKPDFELVALDFSGKSEPPKFIDTPSGAWGDGLFILRSPQCPYTEKNVMAILETAREMNLDPKVVDLTDHLSIRTNPSPFGTFAIIHDGEVLTHHPISNTRFRNIMKSRMSG